MSGYVIDSNRFFFGKNGFNDFDDVRWHPDSPSQDFGIDVSLHGSPAEKYDRGLVNVTYQNGGFMRISSNGLDPRTSVDGTQRFTYFPKDPRMCWAGASYVVAGHGSGIGIYSNIGRDLSGNTAFLQNKRTYSSNPEGYGAYISFPCSHGGLKLFGKGNDRYDVRAGCEVPILQFSAPDEQQVQQKMSFVIHNVVGKGRIEYSINTLLAGMHEDNPFGRIWTDVDQGGTTVFSGPLHKPNIPTKTSDGVELFTSKVHETTHVAGGMRNYRAIVAWLNQLEAMNAAADRSDKSAEDIFGIEWDDPEAWELKQARYAQEVVNPDYEDVGPVRIGSRLQYFQIKPE